MQYSDIERTNAGSGCYINRGMAQYRAQARGGGWLSGGGVRETKRKGEGGEGLYPHQYQCQYSTVPTPEPDLEAADAKPGTAQVRASCVSII